ncbi:MAG: ACP S-malonyltransferase [Ruminiclostridium sp.]|nr:ACP S-malonyltransferase [Ruminiclostridium sp.]
MATALLFSGQGSQYGEMGKRLYDEAPGAYDDIFAAGSDILGFDLKKLMLEGTAEDLAPTGVSQPTIFTMSLMCARKYINGGGEFEAVAGHSLGEYAALVISGAVDMETGFTLIKHRADCMDRWAKKNGGKMAAIIGLPADEIKAVCEEISTADEDYVVPVNFNTPVQTVIAGSETGVAKAMEQLKAKGAKRALPLAVAAAFHSRFMRQAGEEFGELIKDIPIGTPKKAFYSNVLGARLTDFSDIRSLLERHISSPVLFVDELNAMHDAGIGDFVECGPGKALTGMVKKTLSDASATAIDA